MFSSSDYRAFARNALRGKWREAALTAFIAVLIGASLVGQGTARLEFSEEEIQTITANLTAEKISIFTKIVWGIAAYTVVSGIIALIIGGAGQLGYARYNLQIADGKDAKLSDLFSQMDRIGDGFLMNLLRAIYLIGWTMLFVIPGLVKIYSYAMTPYLMCEYPFLSANGAITESRRIMDGNKLDLFFLHLSFIGWGILAAIPSAVALSGLIFGHFMLLPLYFVTVIADMFLYAYMEAAQAAFYRQITFVPTAEQADEQSDDKGSDEP